MITITAYDDRNNRIGDHQLHDDRLNDRQAMEMAYPHFTALCANQYRTRATPMLDGNRYAISLTLIMEVTRT